ncbi:MAG: hypothetical protein KAU38_00795 [Desulfobacterales bacterium]|nr:hypothetical protein [Desulfobacterales bacterium]
MNTDENAKDDRASAGDDSGGQTPEMEEIIDLVDEIPPDDNTGQVEQARETESKTEEDEEELIELTDMVEESSSEAQIGDTTLQGGAEEILEPEGEQGPEEEEPIELTDEVVPEVDSAQEQEEGEEELIELTDEVVPEADSAQEQEEAIELGDLAEEVGFEEELEDVDFAILEEAEQPLVDTVETELEAEDRSESGLEQGVPEPVGGGLEQAVLEKLSDEKLEEIITSVVKQTIEGKVERILLEAAEAAIAKEIERLKQAL